MLLKTTAWDVSNGTNMLKDLMSKGWIYRQYKPSENSHLSKFSVNDKNEDNFKIKLNS